MQLHIPSHLKTFPRMLGIWHGDSEFRDASGQLVRRETIDVDARFEQGRWVQRNRIAAADGTIRDSLVTASFDANGLFRLDTDRVLGTGGEVGEQVVVEWHLKSDPAAKFSELITYLDDDSRVRTWHHYTSAGYLGSTLMQERRIR